MSDWNRSFKNDHSEPPALSQEEINLISGLTVVPRNADKDKPYCWHAVYQGGELIGYVTSRISGQHYRTPTDEDWMPACGYHEKKGPCHGRALLALLKRSAFQKNNLSQ